MNIFIIFKSSFIKSKPLSSDKKSKNLFNIFVFRLYFKKKICLKILTILKFLLNYIQFLFYFKSKNKVKIEYSFNLNFLLVLVKNNLKNYQTIKLINE